MYHKVTALSLIDFYSNLKENKPLTGKIYNNDIYPMRNLQWTLKGLTMKHFHIYYHTILN